MRGIKKSVPEEQGVECDIQSALEKVTVKKTLQPGNSQGFPHRPATKIFVVMKKNRAVDLLISARVMTPKGRNKVPGRFQKLLQTISE